MPKLEGGGTEVTMKIVLTYPVHEAGEFFDEDLPGQVSITNHYHSQTAPVGAVKIMTNQN